MSLATYQQTKSKEAYPGNYVEEIVLAYAFNKGFKAAMDLELHLKFAEWIKSRTYWQRGKMDSMIGFREKTMPELWDEFILTLEL